MKVIIFGSQGMLGSTLFIKARQKDWNVLGVGRYNCDIVDQAKVISLVTDFEPDVLINAAGVIPDAPGKNAVYSDMGMMMTNAAAPLGLAQVARITHTKLVHISTDCVFSGKNKGAHSVEEVPDAVDLYGLSKRAGELCAGPNVTVLRTSFIGPQHGLLRWLMDQPQGATIDGWMDAWWSGSTVYHVADQILNLVDYGLFGGLQQLATGSPITKKEVLQLLVDTLRPDIHVKAVSHPVHRWMVPTITLPPIERAIAELKGMEIV